VFKASPQIIPKLTAHTGKSHRISSHPVAACLANQLDGPITGPAPISQGPEILSPQEVVRCLGDRVDLLSMEDCHPAVKVRPFLISRSLTGYTAGRRHPDATDPGKILFTAATFRRRNHDISFRHTGGSKATTIMKGICHREHAVLEMVVPGDSRVSAESPHRTSRSTLHQLEDCRYRLLLYDHCI